MTRWARVAVLAVLALLVVSTGAVSQVPPPPYVPPPNGDPSAPPPMGPPPFVPPPNVPPPPSRPDPLTMLDALAGKVAGLPGNKGVRQSLQSKLKDARACLVSGDEQGALEALGAFENHTQAQAGKHLEEATAASLLQDARDLADRLSEA